MPNLLKVLTVFGTRPEAIKMAPVVQALAANPDDFESVVCVTAQHRELLDQVLQLFNITPDIDLDLMKPNQDLTQITTAVLLGMRAVLQDVQPDIVLVHGDTTTTMATTLACYYQQIPVGHVEAGLRTFDNYYPFPEEVNRVMTDSLATLYFAPTERSKQNLLKIAPHPEGIYLTGNTVIDALFYTLEHAQCNSPVTLPAGQKLILVTAHRRENFGEPMVEICKALKTIVEQHSDVEIVYPAHPNPNVRKAVDEHLRNVDRIHILEPLEYEPFCKLMEQATLILTDSGGIQEEAPSLKKPVLVLRDETERPEAVDMGTVKLVGPHFDKIVSETRRLLTDEAAYKAMAQAVNPYGDGKASARIMDALRAFQQQRLSTKAEVAAKA